jgi:hypothetical protein
LSNHQHILSEHHFSLVGLVPRYRVRVYVSGFCFAIGLGLMMLVSELPEAWVESGPIVFLLGVITSGYGVFWLLPLLWCSMRSIKKVRISEEGISWTLHGREEFQPWGDVREMLRTEKATNVSRQSEMTLVFKQKEPVVFDQSLSDFLQMVTEVEAIVTERLLPQYRQSLDQGGARFGPVLLKREGLRIHDQDFAWSAIEEYAICNGGLVVTPRGYDDYTGEFVSFQEMPNYMVLLRLLEELGQRPVPASQCIFLAGRNTGNHPPTDIPSA